MTGNPHHPYTHEKQKAMKDRDHCTGLRYTHACLCSEHFLKKGLAKTS